MRDRQVLGFIRLPALTDTAGMKFDKKIINFLLESLTNLGKEAPESRLHQGALVLLKPVALFFSLPAALMHLYLGWRHESSDAAHVMSLSWLILLALHALCLVAVVRLPSGRNRLKRLLIRCSAAFQLLGLGIFVHVSGGLMSPAVVFIPVMIAVYRVFLDYSMGVFVTVFGLSVYLIVIAVEVFGGATTAVYFPELFVPFYAYPWASFCAAMCIASIGVLTFAGLNYGMNQSALLHRYITESVLRRYLPPSLVERAALGELRLDAAPERRVVTVMFVDLVGFTSFSENKSPEAVAAMLNRYLSRSMELAHAQQATVDKFVGDAVMYVFGAPDSLPYAVQVQRAIRLAQDILAELPHLSGDQPLRARIGINTGDVVVGNFGNHLRSDYTVLGHAVNLASRLESVCEPDSILIGPDTARYAGRDFSLVPTGKLRLKGMKEPVVGYYVVQEARPRLVSSMESCDSP